MAKKQQPKAPAPRRQRRTIDEKIANLQAKIAAIKERETRKQAKADPALRHASAALRSLDKALGLAEDSGTKKALGEARSTLVGLLGGGASQNGRVRRTAAEIGDLAGALLSYVRNNPGQRGEEIAAAIIRTPHDPPRHEAADRGREGHDQGAARDDVLAGVGCAETCR
jgi:hypothetical protein